MKNSKETEESDFVLFCTLEQKISKISIWFYDVKTLRLFSAIIIAFLVQK